MADVGLLAALRTLGVNQVTSNSNESSFDVPGDSTLNASTPETTVLSPAQKGVQLGRAELLRATHQLVDGLLRLQSKASSQAPSYLSLVLPCLFKLLNDPHQDVRIAADEGINKLIKLLRVSMTHQVIFELFLELKRNANARTVTVALNKFTGLVHRIRASKRRFYTLNLLPVLVTICERDDESVFDVLSEHFGQIASQLFCHATERELVDFLRKQLVRLSSETALIRRSVAQTLVLTCQYSRVPLTLFRLLLQRILRDLGGTERPSTNVAAGLLSTLRYLSIAWQQVLRSNPVAVEQEAKRASSANLRVRASAMGPSESLTSESTPNKVVRSKLETDDPRLTSSDISSHNTPQYTNELDDRQWSQAFFTCLDYANTSSITLSTAALEALSQFLTARRPLVLFPRQWLSGTTAHWSTNMLENPSSDQTPDADGGTEDVFGQDELTFHPFERTDSIREGPIRDSALDTGPPFPDSWPHVDGGAPTLSRSVSSSSIASSLDADPELHQARQDVQKQLSMVRARMAREEQTSSVVQETGSHSDTNLSAEDYSVLGSVADSSDPSMIMLKGASSGSGSDNVSQGKPTGPLKLLTLTELLTYLVPEEPSSLRESTWLVSYLMLQFRVLPDTVTGPLALLPRSPTNPRTCNQLLAISCLTQIASCCPNQFFRPVSLSQFCALDSMEAETPTSYPNTVDILLRLLHTHSDPQLRGQLCVLFGQLISASLVHDGLLESDGSPVLTNPYDVLLTAIDRVLSSSVESSGTTYRLALSGLRSCVNAVLAVPRRDSAAPSLLETDLASFAVKCVARNLAPAARHSYRLVRREFLLLINDLNWNAINFWETIVLNPAASERLNCLARPHQLMDLAWTETWRLLSDPESELSELAAATLVYTLSDILPNDSRNGSSYLLECSVERRLHYWYPSFYSSACLPIMSSGLLDCWDSQIFPPCMSGLPMELDVGPSGLHSLPLYSRLLYAESMDIGSGGQPGNRESLALTGSLRLFRQCVTGLLELPCASLLSEDRYMLHGVVRCLNRLIGQTHVMELSELWYTPAETMNPKNESPEGFHRQRRPRIALLSWQCLTLLSAAPLTTIDLDLHVDLLYLCTGCLTRWALHSLTEGSISLGAQSMSLDLQHAYTRFSLSLLHHVARVLFILWHVVEELQPSPVPPSSAHADPFHPDSPLSIALQLSRRPHPDTTGPMVNEDQAIPGKPVSSDSSTSGRTPRRPISVKLASPLKKAQQETAATESRRILGYFSHIPHYMSLYQALKVAFQNFKISPDLTGSQDRLMILLRAYLHTLSRLMCNLRLAETAPYSDELLTYVAVLYHCNPAACLEASTQILRAFVGTNLISHWDEQLAKLYNVALSPGLSSSTSFDPRPERATADRNELTKSVETPDSDQTTHPIFGVHGSLEKLWTRYVNYTNVLASPTTDVTPFASWLGLDQLVRTPITAWIRFARQWRVPLPLTSKNSVIRTELTQFFKRFEHIVIQSMEEYKWTTCPNLQSGILNLLTHLVCLQLNYEQLDTGLEFLQTVLKHCENLSLDIHRQQMSPLGSARKRSALDEPWWAFCSGLSTTTPTTTTGRVTQKSQQHQSLVNAIFRFLVTLAYQKQHSSKSNRGLEPQAELTGTTMTNAVRPPAFAQVMHMAETLAAEDLDPGSTVLSALVPIVVDLYVIQRPLISSSVPSHFLEEKAEDPVFKQAEVAREAAFNFFLRRLAHLPASYDQLCLIVEEATLLQLGPSNAQEKRLSNVVSQVVDVVVTHLTDGTMHICTRDDLSSILRICDHIIIALSDCKSTHLVNIRLALDRVLKVTLSVTDKSSPADYEADSTNFSVQWAVAQVCCIRLHLRLLSLLRGHPPSPTNATSNHIQQLTQLLSHAFHVLQQLVLAVHRLLMENPRLAISLNKLTLEDGDTAGVLLQLVSQLTLTHFLTVIELTDCCKSFSERLSEDQTVSPHAFPNPLSSEFQQLSRQVPRLGLFEPLFPALWTRLSVLLVQLFVPSADGRDQALFTAPSIWSTSGHILCVEICAQAHLTEQLRWAVKQGRNKTALLNRIVKPGPEHKLLPTELIRLLDLWRSGVSPIVQLLDELANCPTGGSQLLSYLSESVPFMTVVQLRTMLRLLFRQDRPSHINQRLAILWDHFIAPRPEVPSSVNECSTCRRPSLPLGLQLSAIREASRLFRLLLESEKVDKIVVSNHSMSVPLATIMDYCGRLPKTNALRSSVLELGDLLEQAISVWTHVGSHAPPHGSAPPSNQADLTIDVACVLQHLESGSNIWLPDLAQVLLRQPSCHSHIRGAVRLLQALPDTDATAVQRLTSILRACCSRCYPTLIYFSLVFHSYPRSRHLVCEKQTIKTSQPHTDNTICVTPQLGSLFRTAQQILFDRIQTIVSDPKCLHAVDFDPGLDTSMQCELIGLTTALVHFLQIVPELPAVDVVPMETETLALRFLCVLIEFVLQSLCYDPHESVGSRKSHLNHHSRGCSFSLVQITLELMDRVLQTIPKRLVKGVDVLGDGADQLLTQFVTFFAAVDKFAGLSVPLTYWTLNDHPQLHTRNSTLEDVTMATLLIPKYPSLFGSWFQYTQPASIIATFTSVGAAASASVCLAGGDDTFGGRSLLQSAITERVPPCQVLNKCRLLRSFCVPGMDWSLSGRLNMCLIGCIRLLTLRTSLCSAKKSKPSETLEVNSMLGLEHESIAATVSCFGALAWTDRRQFETLWTNFLELLDPYGIESGGSAPPDSDTGADVELIERNQCVELGFHGLTRLLLDATLRPQPGDPVHSRLCHHPRMATPQFLHTRLGQKLNGLVTLIECERLRCSRFQNVALRSLDSCSVATDFVGVLGHVTTASADLVACLVEPNIERLCDPPGTAGLSQFSISWLVRRLQPSSRTNLTAIGSELKTDLLDLADSAPVSPSSPFVVPRLWGVSSEGRVVTDYDEVLFSCLQSSQLLFQSWLRPANATQSTGSQSGSEEIVSGSHVSGYSEPGTVVGTVSAVRTSIRSDPVQAKRSSTGQTAKPGYPALAVSSALVRSVVLLSDLFTTREQFEWLQGYLSEFVGKLPSLSDFPAPIQQWLTIGLAKSSAVLEVAASGPENVELLQPGSLDLAVRQTLMALQSNQITLQNAGLQAAMWLLHAALLVRAQPHQSQLQQHSPPTGSPVLNELYSQLCSYLERKLDALFGPLRSIRSSVAEYTDSLKTTWTDRPVAEQDKTAGASGLKRFMTGMFGVSAGSKTGVIGAASNVKPFDATTFSANASNGNSFQTERVERHQLTILAAAFFLAENFSAPPVHPVLTDFGSGLTEMLSGLTSNLFRLGSFMLSDSAPSTLLGTKSLHTSHVALGTGTTAHLCCSLLVHTAWCRGIGRLVMMGRLGKGATESLQKLCVSRLRACRSPLISLPVLRLLVTCMYANAGRLNHQLRQYQRASSLMGTVPTEHTESSMMNSATSDDIPLTRKSLTLPPSVVVDSEAAAGMTQEFLSCLWERLRGGIAPVLASPSSSTSTWVSSAWTSAVEATVVADLLPSTSMDIIQALSVSYIPSNQDSDYEKQRDEHISDPVLNKALGEFARLDHANPQLAAQTLAQLFGRFLDNEEGQALIRQWVLLALPTLLGREPPQLAVWATTVCLLSASTHPALRRALCLYSMDMGVHSSLFGQPTSVPSMTAVNKHSPPLMSDLLCLSAVHFVLSGLLRPLPSEERSRDRAVFLRMFQSLCEDSDEQDGRHSFEATKARPEFSAFRRVYGLLRRELGDRTCELSSSVV